MAEFLRTTPVHRIFDIAKAHEFYVGFLGFRIDWEHRFEPDLPLYMQVSLGGIHLHLSEHHGDASPGAKTLIATRGLAAYRADLIGKGYRYMRPGLERQPWGETTMTVVDPFYNRLIFSEPTAPA
jgi:catechol 2,3-dioxygenase-like lactoylglutathione lyase family enzyme